MSMLAAIFVMLSGTGDVAASNQPAATEVELAKSKAETVQADPIICQSQNELGSRIKRRRVCMHKSEWDRQKLENKQMIDRTQVLRGMQPAG